MSFFGSEGIAELRKIVHKNLSQLTNEEVDQLQAVKQRFELPSMDLLWSPGHALRADDLVGGIRCLSLGGRL